MCRMNTDGYSLLKEFVYVSPFIKKLEAYRNKTDYIFNGQGHNDHKRQQVKLPASMVKVIQQKLQTLYPNHTVQDFVLLKSLPGCQRQQAHTDYIPDIALHQCPNEKLPLLCLVAIEPNTRLIVWPGSHKVVQGLGRSKEPIEPKMLVLDVGDAVVFRADLVHAGAEYDSENIRIHCYLDTDLVPRDPNRTWILQKHSDTLIQQKILEP